MIRQAATESVDFWNLELIEHFLDNWRLPEDEVPTEDE